nr:DegV family protein [Chakrabartyella piscis]
MGINYMISCCSTADLSAEHFKKIDVEYICFHFELDGEQYMDDLGKSIPFDTFYEAMKNGADTKTAQVNVSEYEEFFEPFLKQGKDILHVCLSSGLSGTMNSACIAKEILAEKYPERKIYIVDSLSASSGFGMMMDKLSELREQGLSIDEAYDWIETHKLESHCWFFSTDLTFYIKGGRVSKASGLIGGALKVCPLLHINEEGKLIPQKKIRGKNRAIDEIVKCMENHAMDGLEYSDKCYISHSYCYEDAKKVATLIEEKFPNLKGNVEINYIGTTIGSHTGPGTVALFFWGNSRAM